MSEQVAEARNNPQHTAKNFQFGVRQLLMYVVFVALSFGLLKSPYVILSILAKTFVIGALITAILLAIYRTGRLRAFWVGFAVVGSIYFYLTSVSESFRSTAYQTMPFNAYASMYPQQLNNDESNHILTNWILANAYRYIAGQQQLVPPSYAPAYATPTTTIYAPPSPTSGTTISSGTLILQPSNPVSTYQPNNPSYPTTSQAISYGPIVPWSIFYSNGQCIFAILFAYIGGMFAQWLYLKRESRKSSD